MKHFFIVVILAVFAASPVAAERVDNVLAQMVPDDSLTLVGMRMEQLKATPLFRKLIAQQKLPQMDEFAQTSGFDPRRDVRDVLLAFNGQQTVLLARGNFHLNLEKMKRFNYHGYQIVAASHAGGFCILDATLAAAGPLPVLESALDQYKSGKRTNAAVLLTRARAIPDNFQLWGVTNGEASFISQNLPAPAQGVDLGRIFRSLRDSWFEADLRAGLQGLAEGSCASPQDAKSLGDAFRGMVGMGRLKTPENQPELLRLWDGIKVEQVDRKVTIKVDIAQELIDDLLKMIQWGNRPKLP